MNRFIPGTLASATFFQAYLVDGLARWNEDRGMAEEGRVEPHSYSGLLRHAVNQLAEEGPDIHTSTEIHCVPPAPAAPPTRRSPASAAPPTSVSPAPATPPTSQSPATAVPSTAQSPAATGVLATAPPSATGPSAVAPDLVSSSDSSVGPDNIPGYAAVQDVKSHSLALTQEEAQHIIALWQGFSDFDKGRTTYPPRHQQTLNTGRFRTTKKIVAAGVEWW